MEIVHIVGGAVVGEVEVVGLGRIFGGKGVDLLHHRGDAEILAQGAHFGHRRAGGFVAIHGACHLKVAEPLLLGLTQQFWLELPESVGFRHLILSVDDVLQTVEKPLVDLGELVDAVD